VGRGRGACLASPALALPSQPRKFLWLRAAWLGGGGRRERYEGGSKGREGGRERLGNSEERVEGGSEGSDLGTRRNG